MSTARAAAPVLLAVLGLCGTGTCRAQELEGWSFVHSSAAYDYRISLESIRRTGEDPNSGGVVELYVAQMLVRYADAARQEVAARVRNRAHRSEGYGGYVTTTHLVEVRCDDRSLEVRRSTDFDRDGTVLGEWSRGTGPDRPPIEPEPSSVAPLVEGACGGS